MEIINYNSNYKEQFISLYRKIVLEAPIYEELWLPKEVSEILDENDVYLLVNEEKLIGFICGRSYTTITSISDAEARIVKPNNKIGSYYISGLGIANHSRGKGLGEKLIRHILAEKLNDGKVNFIVYSSSHNPVQKLYGRIGFMPIVDDKGDFIETGSESIISHGKKLKKGLFLSFSIPSLCDLKETFDFIKFRFYKNVQGVIMFDTGKKGPTLGITMCTHGNEPAGLSILWYFIKYNYWTKITSGRIIFVLQNLVATQNFFEDLMLPSRNKHRFFDLNFNRLPEDSLEGIHDISPYEQKRLKELYDVYQEFEYGFDIHTSSNENPMIIAGSQFFPELVKGFPIDIVLTNISKPQIGFPSFEFFGGLGNEIPVFEIEAGTHESPNSFYLTIRCTLALLTNLKLIIGKTVKEVDRYKEYYIYDTVFFENESFKLAKRFDYFEEIKQGQLLATGIIEGEEVKIIAKDAGHTIFPPIGQLSSPFLHEEQMFLSKPMKLVS